MQETKSEIVLELCTTTASLGQGLTGPGWVEMGSCAVGRVGESPSGGAGQGQLGLLVPSGLWYLLQP